MSLKLEVRKVKLEQKEEFWNKLDDIVDRVPRAERVGTGVDLSGHVGEGNKDDEELLDSYVN